MKHRLTRMFTVTSAAAALLGATGVSGSAVASVSIHTNSRSTFTTWRVIYRAQHTPLGPAVATGPRHVWVLAAHAAENFLLRWNGTSWQKTKPMPSGFDPKTFSPFLIKASGPDNIWVFGNVSDPFTHPEAIVWNGRSWQAPAPQLPAMVLRNPVGDGDAVVVSRSDVWYSDGGHLFHWNGTAWKVSQFGAFDASHDLAATPSGVVWRVTTVRASGHYTPRAQTWTGARWRAVRLPRITIRQWPISVSIWSSHDIWLGMRRSANDQGVLLHWNGSRWRTISIPPYADGAYPTAIGGHGAWVSGLALWNGSSWLVGRNGFLGEGMTGIPGTKSALAPLDGTGRRAVGEIWLNGRLP